MRQTGCFLSFASFLLGTIAVDGFSAFLHTPRRRRVLLPLYQSTAGTDTEDYSSADMFSGGGAAQVDMNQYNLDPGDISAEWTAVLVPQNDFLEEGAYLAAKNKRSIMVDTVKMEFARGQGLGIELLELAGGREDGLGITVVSGLVEGGAAEFSGIQPGDSIIKAAVIRRRDGADDANDELSSVQMECLGYDMTVQAIGSLPARQSENEYMVLTVKRLRRKPKVKVNFQYPPEMGEKDITIELFAGENLRRSMLVKGIKLNDPLAKRFDSGGSGDCGAEGTCATCAVSIGKGADLLNPVGSTEEQIFKNNPRWRMACKTIVGYGMKEGELTVRVNPRQW